MQERKKFVYANFTTKELVTTLKLLSYIAYCVKFKETPNIPKATLQQWHSETLDFFAKSKIKVEKTINAMMTLCPPNNRISKLGGKKLNELTKRFRDIVYAKKSVILANPAAVADLRTLLGFMFTFFNSKSENSYENIAKKVSILKEPLLSQHIRSAETTADVNDVHNYQKFVRGLTGKTGWVDLTTEQQKKLSPRDLEKYKALKKASDASRKEKMRDIVRESGEQHVPIEKAIKELKQEGYPVHHIPKGFVGRIDENNKLYTKHGVPLATGQNGGTMEMNPEYDHKKDDAHIATGIAAMAKKGAKPQYFYSQNYVDQRSGKKQKKAQDLEENIDALQQEWQNDFMHGKPNDKILGAILETLYNTQARIGSNSSDNYGLTTWAVRHVKQLSNGDLSITYLGKSGMVNKHIIKPDNPIKQALIAYIMKLTKGKQKNDPVWTDKNGNQITAQVVRDYLKELGYDGGPHAFRHFKGNEVFRAMLKKHKLKKKPTIKEVNDYHKFITTQVGKVLGHKRTDKTGKEIPVGTTASKSYISPELQKKIFTENGAPIPRALEKLEKDF